MPSGGMFGSQAMPINSIYRYSEPGGTITDDKARCVNRVVCTSSDALLFNKLLTCRNFEILHAEQSLVIRPHVNWQEAGQAGKLLELVDGVLVGIFRVDALAFCEGNLLPAN